MEGDYNLELLDPEVLDFYRQNKGGHKRYRVVLGKLFSLRMCTLPFPLGKSWTLDTISNQRVE